MRRIAAEGSLAHIEELPDDLRSVFVSAHDVSPEWHIRMQAAFQRHTDNAVSKTVNFRADATRQEVEQAYLLAWKLGCKGVTIYRDGSRESQVLNIGEVNKEKKADEVPGTVLSPRPRPPIMKTSRSFRKLNIAAESCRYAEKKAYALGVSYYTYAGYNGQLSRRRRSGGR